MAKILVFWRCPENGDYGDGLNLQSLACSENIIAPNW